MTLSRWERFKIALAGHSVHAAEQIRLHNQQLRQLQIALLKECVELRRERDQLKAEIDTLRSGGE